MSLFSSSFVELPLKPRWLSRLLLSSVALVALAGCAEGTKIAVAAALGRSTLISEVKKGLALDPDNAALHNRLGRLYADTPGLSNLAEGVAQARRATALNPNKSEYWLTLASACESVHDSACAAQALQHSLVLSPEVPWVWWVAANHYLRTDRPQAALSCFRRLLELSPGYATPAFDLTLHAYGDPQSIFENVAGGGKDPGLALAFADLLSANNDFDAAYQVWTETVSQGSQFSFVAVRPYLDCLLSHGRYLEAWAIWVYLERREIIAKPADSAIGNLVFNGGFEQPPLGAGFDWNSQPSPYVSVDFADSSSFAGRRCLRLDFPVGQNDEFEPVYQTIPVVPHQAYALTAYVRSSDITSASGPRLRVTDPLCAGCLNASTDSTVGSTPWHMVTLQFSVGPQTHAVRLSVWRPRSRTFPMDISGSFWLDTVSVRGEGQ
jgi:tetratricopeptide (TPR) repeat protein